MERERERMGVESSKIMSPNEERNRRATATIVQSQEPRGSAERGGARASPSDPPAQPRLWSWSTRGKQLVVRDSSSSVSSKVAPAQMEGEVELQDVEIGTAPSSPAVVVYKEENNRRLQSTEGDTAKPLEKEAPAAEGRASYLGWALLMYSGRWPWRDFRVRGE